MKHEIHKPRKPSGPARHLVPVTDDAGTLIGFYDPKPGPLGHIEYFRPDQTKIGGAGSIAGALRELERRAIAPHPRYGAPLGGLPQECDGVTFRPYRTGIGSTARVSDCHRIIVYQPIHTATFLASVDGEVLGTRFRSRVTAYQAGVRHMRSKDRRATAPK